MRIRRLVAVLSIFVLFVSIIPVSGRAAQGDTFRFGAEVRLCDYTQDPASLDPTLEAFGPSAWCQVPADGAVISVTEVGGASLGSCTVGSYPGPQGATYSSCGVDGFKRNTEYLFELDLSSVPDGYEFESNTQTLEVGDEIPGGGDGFVISFRGIKGEQPDDSEFGGSSVFVAELQNASCGSAGDERIILNPPTLELGSPVGLESGVGPIVSESSVAIHLDTIIDEPHSVRVEHDGETVLCGDVGGVDNEDGVIRIVLIGASGFAGVVALSYAEGGSTSIVVYVIEIE